MKTTKILALLLAILMAVGCLAACTDNGGTDESTAPSGGASADGLQFVPWSEEDIKDIGENYIKPEADKNGGKIELQLWQPEAALETFQKQADNFAELFKDYADITITLKAQGENDVAGFVVSDPKAAADVFGFASDQLTKLKDGDAISEIYYTNEITALNKAGAVDAATIDGKIYGYPEVGDNSYILAYDTRLLDAAEVATFESLLEACKGEGKNFIIDLGNGYFTCMFLFTGGLRPAGISYTEENDAVQELNDYDMAEVVDSVQAFADLFKPYIESTTLVSGATEKVVDGFKNGTTAAGIVGSWNIKATKAALTDADGTCYAGFATIPTININGTATPVVNMFGYKFLGVNSQSKYPQTAQALAYYLSNEQCQQERYDELAWNPSNIALIESDTFKNDASAAAFLAQEEFSVPQTTIVSFFWDPCAALGAYISEPKNDFSDAAIQKEIENCISGLKNEG